MTNHLAMWHYWMLRDRNRSSARDALLGEHTTAEQDIFDQRMTHLRAKI